MKVQELVRRSIDIITNYYDNKLEPFFEAIADEVLWIGPRGGQVMQGKEMIVKTWSGQEDHGLRFTMGNIEAKTVSVGASSLEVLLEYYVYTFFPNGESDEHHQRLHLSWGCRRKNPDGKRIPQIFMIHISNISDEQPGKPSDGNVRVYASSHLESHYDAVSSPSLSRIFFRTVYGRGKSEITYYFNSSTILYIESADRSLHSIVHTLEGPYESIEKLRYFEENFGSEMLHAHASYIINPMYVRSVQRFQVTLTDGTVIPIPEKKYTAFRDQLRNWTLNQREHLSFVQ